uniref:Uncharacterized protein n=1 Tax=Anguilla anguilla TaxID=7936 RepID=A0A0E9U723_ANGAN
MLVCRETVGRRTLIQSLCAGIIFPVERCGILKLYLLKICCLCASEYWVLVGSLPTMSKIVMTMLESAIKIRRMTAVLCSPWWIRMPQFSRASPLMHTFAQKHRPV